MTKYYDDFQNSVEISASPPIQCCEPITQLDATFAHCFSTFLRGGRKYKQNIAQIAYFPMIFFTDCLKKSENLSAVFYTSSLYIKLKACNYPLRHNFAMVSNYLNNRNIQNFFGNYEKIIWFG